MYRLYVALSLLLLISCSSGTHLAPVVELTWQKQNAAASNVHIVRAGETLYAIAFRHDRDYRELAVANHLKSPYALQIGQRLLLAKKKIVAAKPQRMKKITTEKKLVVSTDAYHQKESKWLWPIRGRVATHFIPYQGKKGIDIAGKKGDKIHAAANGVVAYAGSGLTGYGNLIIIKHDNQLLTAYGNNKRNLVAEGQKVKAGQIIAEMGVVDRRFWGLHFEIRKAGKPINPLLYLQKS